MHKNESSVISINIGMTVKITLRSPRGGKPLIKASRVYFHLLQVKKLQQIAQREAKATNEVIRKGVKRFLNKQTFERNTFNFDASSARGTKRIYPRFSKSDWDMLDKLSKKMNRHRTELVREAVDGYLRDSS